MTTRLLEILTGPLKEKLPQLRIKDNADHAGPSQPLEFWNHGSSSRDKEPTSQSNNWLTAQDPKEIKDATVDGLTLPLATSKPTVLLMKLLIPTLLGIKHARPKVEPIKLLDTAATLDAMD